MRVSRPAAIALAILVVAAVVVGVVVLRQRDPGDDFDAYCSVVRDRRDEIGAAVAAGPETGLIRALPSFEALAEKAPEDIRDEWTVVTSRIRALRDAFERAGVDPASYDRKHPPASVSAADRAAIETAAVRLGAEDTRAALAGVDQQARDVCHTPLSL